MEDLSILDIRKCPFPVAAITSCHGCQNAEVFLSNSSSSYISTENLLVQFQSTQSLVHISNTSQNKSCFHLVIVQEGLIAFVIQYPTQFYQHRMNMHQHFARIRKINTCFHQQHLNNVLIVLTFDGLFTFSVVFSVNTNKSCTFITFRDIIYHWMQSCQSVLLTMFQFLPRFNKYLLAIQLFSLKSSSSTRAFTFDDLFRTIKSNCFHLLLMVRRTI